MLRYSPSTASPGRSAPHPSLADPEYRDRRDQIARQAAGPGHPPTPIDYSPAEHEVWISVQAALAPLLERFAAAEILDAQERLGLPADRVPQLTEVSERLAALSGFRYEAVPGLVAKETFFAALADSCFLSTQYVRHPSSPLYTPEPDVIHEVTGHARLLADPLLAEMHRSAGRAMSRLETEVGRQVVADVFWFSGEFGVVAGPTPRAYGAGLISSVGELGWFAGNAEIRPIDLEAMATLAYDITQYQPVLFAADSITHAVETVTGFFDSLTDELAARLAAPDH